MNAIGPAEILRILAVTDALGIHREAVRVPLETKPGGELRRAGDRLVIAAPSDADLDSWLAALPDRIRSVDLSGVKLSEDPPVSP